MKDLKAGYTFCVFAFNEESVIGQTLIECINVFKKLQIDGEIIFVNDGSSDLTFEIAKHTLKSSNINYKIINKELNAGPTQAMISAAIIADFERFVLVPGDLTYDCNNIASVIKFDLSFFESLRLTLGVRSKKRLKRSLLRELASYVSTMSMIWVNPKNGFVKNYGFVIAPSKIAQIVPKKIGPYGQAVGLISCCLVLKCKINYCQINQVAGSEQRSSRLNIKKINDIVSSHFAILVNYKKIQKSIKL